MSAIGPSESFSQPAPLLVIPGLAGSCAGLLTAAEEIFPSFIRIPFNHQTGLPVPSFEEYAELARAALPADQPAYVCGESFGGPIALTLARRYPERVLGLVLLSTFAHLPRAGSTHARLLLPIWSALI